MSLRERVLSALRWSFVAKGIGQFFNWAITIYVIRLLSPEDYGLMATAMVFVGVLVPLGELGLGAAIIQRTEIDDDLVSKVFGVVLAISITLSVLLYSAAGLIANAFDEIRLIPVIEVLSLGLLISSFAVVPRALLTREIDFRSQSIVDMVSNLLGGVVVLVLALEGYAVWALVWSYIILTAVRSVGLNICAARLRWPRFDLSGIGALVSYGAWLTLANFAWLISVHIDTLLVSKLLGMNPLGFYSVGKQLAHLPQSKIQGILNNVAFSAFSQIQDNPILARDHLLKYVRVSSIVSFPIFLGICAIAPEFVRVVLGEK